MHRRTLLAGVPLAGLAAALPRPAPAQAPAPAALPAAQRFRVGDRSVTALSDGALSLGVEPLQGVGPQDYDALMREAFRDPETYRTAVNAFLIEGGDGLVLVDAGTGGALGPGLGRLLGNLRAAGFAPEDVTLLIATHLHADHVGGAFDGGGAAVFPNAEMAVRAAERDFWTDPANREAAPEGMRMFFDAATAAVDAYADRLRVLDGAAEIAPGLTSMMLPGHTPGHMGVMVDGGGADGLLIWADIVHVPPIQFARPEVSIAFDVDPGQAAETRAAILDRAAADRLMVAGSHMTFPGLAHIERAEQGYRAVAAPYDYPD